MVCSTLGRMDETEVRLAGSVWAGAIERCYELAEGLPWWAFVRRHRLVSKAHRMEGGVRANPRRAVLVALAYHELRESGANPPLAGSADDELRPGHRLVADDLEVRLEQRPVSVLIPCPAVAVTVLLVSLPVR